MAETQVVRTEGHTFDGQPWEYQLELDYGQFIYVSVESREEHGTIGCEILIDDQVVEKATSRDSYVVATCGGSAGK